MDKLITPEHKAMAASWLRVFIAASLAMYTAGVTDPMALFNAGFAALIPVVIRYFNAKDPAYGRVVEAVLTTAKEKVAKAAATPRKKSTTTKK
jgi:hypothetical protein